MGRPKSNKHILKRTRNKPEINQGGMLELLDDSETKEKYFGLFITIALFAFGVYHSVLYFGHQVVPNSDFTAFVQVGHELLSFQLPTSYKRVPVVGLLQAICLSVHLGSKTLFHFLIPSLRYIRGFTILHQSIIGLILVYCFLEG